VIATGFGAQRRRRARTAVETTPVLGQRAPEFEPREGDLDVPSFLRGE
jgi:hypothetical protein